MFTLIKNKPIHTASLFMEANLLVARSFSVLIDHLRKLDKARDASTLDLAFCYEDENPLVEFIQRLDHPIYTLSSLTIATPPHDAIVVIGPIFNTSRFESVVRRYIGSISIIVVNTPVLTYDTEVINHTDSDVLLWNPSSFAPHSVVHTRKWFDPFLFQSIHHQSSLCPVIYFESKPNHVGPFSVNLMV